MPLTSILLQPITATPDYTVQLKEIVKALNNHEAIPSWLLGTIIGFLLGLLAECVISPFRSPFSFESDQAFHDSDRSFGAKRRW